METPHYMEKYWREIADDSRKLYLRALANLARIAEQMDSQLVMEFEGDEKEV